MAPELALPIETPLEAAEQASFSMDEERFRRFYAQTARPLRAYLSRLSGDGVLADDLLQEAYLRFLRAERPEMNDSGEKNYLYRIATNLFHDHYRRNKRIEPNLPEIPVGERTGDEIHLRTDVSRVFQQLKPRERQLLWLAYVEGSSHKEIAEVAGLKAASIRLLLFRARHRLARLLRDKGLGPDDFIKVRR
jgi:RNA polymerase sigma-70 factor (ECF subfamily)